MNFPDFLKDLHEDPRFQELPAPVRLFFLESFCSVDRAGWFTPRPRILAVYNPDLEFEKAAAMLDPWIRVHPSGWWSVKDYVKVQCPDGIHKDSPFHKMMRRVLGIHRDRELEAGADYDPTDGYLPKSEATSPSGALAPELSAASPTPAKSSVNPSPTAESQRSRVPSQRSIAEVESPTRGSGGDLTYSEHALAQTAVATLTDPEPDPGEGLNGVLRLFETMLHAPVVNPPDWILTSLKEAARPKGWPPVQRAAAAYLTAPASNTSGRHSLEDFAKTGTLARFLKDPCEHKSVRHYVIPLDSYKYGRKQKQQACNAKGCRWHEVIEEWLVDAQSHTCNTEIPDQHGVIFDEHGVLHNVAPGSWGICDLCGRPSKIEGGAS